MQNIIAIFIGGGCGAVCRFITGILAVRYLSVNLPVATFAVNFVGSFILGFLYAFFMERPEISPAMKFALTAGFCGGLTTFSTFSLEVFEMIKNVQIFQAFAYVVLSLAICLSAVWIGVNCAKIF